MMASRPRPHAYGALLRERRMKRDLGLRELGRRVGLSHALLATVEAGLRRPLHHRYEPALIRALGNLTQRQLDRARNLSTPLQIATGELSAADVGLVRRLVERLACGELGPEQLAQLRAIVTSRSSPRSARSGARARKPSRA